MMHGQHEKPGMREMMAGKKKPPMKKKGGMLKEKMCKGGMK